MPRRDSTSSGETIIYESAERRKTVAGSSKPCPQCEKLLLGALESPVPDFSSKENPDEGDSDEDGGLTPWSEKSKSKSHFRQDKPLEAAPKSRLCTRSFSGVQDLQVSARNCPVCRLLWQILRGADDTLLDQVLRYGNDEFNATSLYLPDGGTDLEELMNPGPKVKLTASATLEYPGPPQSPSSHSSRLSDPSFLLQRRPQLMELAESAGISLDGWLHHLPDYTRHRRRVCVYRTPSLRLQLTVAYKAQPGSRKSTTTTVEEGLTVFWSSVNDGVDTDRRIPYHLSLSTLISGDLRLNDDLKWNLLTSWVTKASRTVSRYTSNEYPSRVLHLTQDGRIKLVEGFQETYTALSHRWGTSRHLTATTQTLEELKSGISTDLLPLTFRDAVYATRRLGVNYLWIDALCIIQDDKADWQRESRAMGDIFMNAKFVLAAHCAADDSEGFLTEALSTRGTIELELPDTSQSGGTIGICRHSNLETDVTNSALSKRGWVLQERFLATHTLHFTRHGVFSEAGSELFSEDGRLEPKARKGMGTAFLGPSALPDLRCFLTDTNVYETADVFRRLWEQTTLDWLTLTEMYTNCDLTREEDKLFAIAGIARKIQSRKTSVWCAGLWGDRISYGLLWVSGQRLSAPTKPRAPSWSWAAWDGPIQYPEIVKDGAFQARAQFVSIHGPTAGIWLDGPGLLRIRAKIIPLDSVVLTQDCAQLGPGPERRGYLTSNHPDLPRLVLRQYFQAYTLRGRGYTPKNRDNMRGPRLVVRADRLPSCGWITFDDTSTTWIQHLGFDDDSNISLQGCCFALLGTYRASNKGLVYLGIFLQLIEGSDSGHPEYCRIGYGQMSHSFLSGENLDADTRGPGGLDWSAKSDYSYYPQPPPDLARTSIISIR